MSYKCVNDLEYKIKAYKTICKYIYKYIKTYKTLKSKILINDTIELQKIYYKKYYPLRLRFNSVIHVMKFLKYNQKSHIKLDVILFININKSKFSITNLFNEVIDALDIYTFRCAQNELLKFKIKNS